MWYLLLGLGGVWYWYRRSHGLPLLPGQKHPFSAGAILVPTPTGVVAIPADTPAVHPAVAASAGLLSPSATLNLAQALQRGASLPDPASLGAHADAGNALLSGAWAMFDPQAGAGGDVRVDELGMPRSNSMASRRWATR